MITGIVDLHVSLLSCPQISKSIFLYATVIKESLNRFSHNRLLLVVIIIIVIVVVVNICFDSWGRLYECHILDICYG